jgi:hypothetical protein
MAGLVFPMPHHKHETQVVKGGNTCSKIEIFIGMEYGIPNAWVFCQVPFCYLPASLCQIAKSTLPSPCFAIFFVKFIFSLCQLNDTKLHESRLPKLAFLICQLHFAKLQS